MRTDHQQLERVFIQNAVGEQAQQVAHAELVNLHTSQIADFGFTGLRLADDGSDRFVKRLDAQKLEGMVQYNAFPPNSELPRIKNFSQRYKAKFGEEAHGFAAQSYDGVMVAVAAMQAAGSVTDGKAIRDALVKVDYQGVIGPIKFDKKGQASPNVYVTQWCANGTRRILYPESAKAGCGAG